MDMVDKTNYVIPNNKIPNNSVIKVKTVADYHNYTFDQEKSHLLAIELQKDEPHHINIAGDIFDAYQWSNDECLKRLRYHLSEISESSDIILSLGNHDLSPKDDYNRKVVYYNFKKLESIRPGKIFPLINDIFSLNGFDYVGFTPSREIIRNLSIQDNGIAHDRFIQEYLKRNINLYESKNIVEFCGHNPHLIAVSLNGIGLEGLKNIDTFNTGHLHNGYFTTYKTNLNPEEYLDIGYVEKPYNLDSNGNLVFSSINPLFFGKINLCRGVVFIDDNSNQLILELTNNTYWINNSLELRNPKWKKINNNDAVNIILNKKLHAVVISGGINKFSFIPFNIKNDKPEITEYVYMNEKSYKRIKTI